MPAPRIASLLAAFLMFLCGLLLARPAWADTYYVAPGGSDANDGSASAPWATLQHAADQVAPGDTVLVQDGTYVGFQISTSGTAAQPIVFKADGTNVVVNAVNPVRGDDNINVEGGDYVVIDGFRVRDADRAGIRVVIARGVIVRNNIVGPNGKWGIFTGFAPDVQILNNETFGSGDEHGIYVSNSNVSADNPVIRGNNSHSNQGNGIQLNGDCFASGDGLIEGALIENNRVHHNQLKGFSLISIAESVIQNNLIYENGLSAGAGGIHLVDEPGCGNPSVDNVVVNNTIHEPRIAGIRMNDGATDNIVFNNLIVSDRDIRDEVGGNHIDATSNYTTTSLDGLFVDAASGDYHLLPDTPPVDLGVSSFMGADAPACDLDGLERPRDAAHDAGAFEYPGELPVELVAFEAMRDAEGVVLSWQTASETNNAGFEIQRISKNVGADGRPPDWETVAFVEGAGTTLEAQHYSYRVADLAPGQYLFRLNQVDYDGTCEVSVAVEVAVEVPGAYVLSSVYPNPFNPVARFSLSVRHRQPVEVSVFDIQGRQVRTLYRGTLAANEARAFVLEAGDLPSGLYLIRAAGKTFEATRRVMLLK